MKLPLYIWLAAPLLAIPSIASAQITFANGTITLTGTASNDTASVAVEPTGLVEVRLGAARTTYTAATVQRVVFRGLNGADTFTNSTSIPSEADGGDGNDTLTGGSGDDYFIGNYGDDLLFGGPGADVLFGSGGNDELHGGTGSDRLKGHGGTDELFGDSGNDALYGGSGTDTLDGGSSADTLVTVGGDTDAVSGGTGDDFFWIGTGDTLPDVSATESFGRFVNRIDAFHGLSYDGGATAYTPDVDLTDFDLPDPEPQGNDTYTLENYGDHPLFAAIGPSAEDVDQNEIGDCNILGPISAVADATPNSIRKLVVDLDDGTYAVRFYDEHSGAAAYVRVDADLYTHSNGTLPYAGLGVDGAIWAPIVEKALAFFRYDTGSYDDISGQGGASWLFDANKEIRNFGTLGEADILAWHQGGERPSPTADHVNAAVIDMLEWIDARQAEGHPIYTNYDGTGLTNTSALTSARWRSASHQVMVDRVLFDANGVPNGLVIRDQNDTGANAYVTFTSFSRIYFFFGLAVKFRIP